MTHAETRVFDLQRRFAIAVLKRRPREDPRGGLGGLSPSAVVATPVQPRERPRERREQRHAARTTSSGDSGDDRPAAPEPLPGFDCSRCGRPLVLTGDRSVCPSAYCPGPTP